MLKQALKLYTDLIGIGDMIEYQIYQTAISQTNTHRNTVEQDIDVACIQETYLSNSHQG